ncbi:MAG: hypothetical protein ABI442_08975 [Gemmatimonadaceae bacterium]
MASSPGAIDELERESEGDVDVETDGPDPFDEQAAKSVDAASVASTAAVRELSILLTP